MKTAQQYIDKMLLVNGRYTVEQIKNAINEARIEAIKECAEKARTNSDCNYWNCEGQSVNKQSILSLIDTLS